MKPKDLLPLFCACLILQNCGTQTKSNTRPETQISTQSSRTNKNTPPLAQDATGSPTDSSPQSPNSAENSQQPSEPSDTEKNLPSLEPSKLAWNGETFVGSASFALIPLE